MGFTIIDGKYVPTFKLLYPDTYLKPALLTKKQREILKKLAWWNAGRLVEKMWLIGPYGTRGIHSYFGLERGGFFEQPVSFEDIKFLRRNGWICREEGDERYYNITQHGAMYV